MITGLADQMHELFDFAMQPNFSKITIINDPKLVNREIPKLALENTNVSFKVVIGEYCLELFPMSNIDERMRPISFGYTSDSEEKRRTQLNALGKNFVHALAEIDNRFKYPDDPKESLVDLSYRLRTGASPIPKDQTAIPIPHSSEELKAQNDTILNAPIEIPLEPLGPTAPRVVTYPGANEVPVPESFGVKKRVDEKE